MPRKATGKVMEDRVWARQKNGTWYCYARKRIWRDGKTVELEKKLIGKADERGGELRPTRAKRKPGADRTDALDAGPAVAATPADAGIDMCDLLEFVGSASGIDYDLSAVTDAPTADRLASLARYLAATDGAEPYGIEEWQLTHPVPCRRAFTADDCAALLREVGTDEFLVQGFFAARIAREEDPRTLVAYDATDTRAEGLPDKTYADHVAAPGSGPLVLFSLSSKRPLAYAHRPEHVPDAISWDQALARFEALGAKDVTLAPGRIPEDALGAILRTGRHVLVEASVEWAWVREQVEAYLHDLRSSGNVLDFDVLTRAVTLSLSLDLSRLGSAGAPADEGTGAAAGRTGRLERQAYLHVYFDQVLKEEQDREFWLELKDVEALVSAGVPLDGHAAGLRDAFLDVRGRGRRVTVTWRKDAVSEACRLNGVFALVSDSLEDANQALEAHRTRERVTRPLARTGKRRGWGGAEHALGRETPESLDGRLFARFLAVCYTEYLHERVRGMTATLGRRNGVPDHDRQENLELELELRRWLEARTPQRILAWFDARRDLGVPNGVTSMRWSEEATARDALLLRLLGIAGGDGRP